MLCKQTTLIGKMSVSRSDIYTCIYVYMYICTYIHVHMYMYTCTCIYVYMYMYIGIHVHMYMYTCTCINIYIYVCTFPLTLRITVTVIGLFKHCFV